MQKYIIKNIIREEVDFIMKCKNQNMSIEDIAFILEMKNFVENRFLNENKIGDVIKMIIQKTQSMISSIKKLNLTVVSWIAKVATKLPGLLGKYMKKMILLLLLSSALLNAGTAAAAMGHDQVEQNNKTGAHETLDAMKNGDFFGDNSDFFGKSSTQDHSEKSNDDGDNSRRNNSHRNSSTQEPTQQNNSPEPARKGNKQDAKLALEIVAGSLAKYFELSGGLRGDKHGFGNFDIGSAIIDLQHLVRDSNTPTSIDSMITHSDDVNDLMGDVMNWAIKTIATDQADFKQLISMMQDKNVKAYPGWALRDLGEDVLDVSKHCLEYSVNFVPYNSPPLDTPHLSYWSN